MLHTAPELICHTVASQCVFRESGEDSDALGFAALGKLADAGGSLCWEALVTRRFLPRFTWRWRTRLSAWAQPPPVRATSTWAPSWAPPGAPGPRLWVRMNPSAAAVPYVVSGTLEFVFKKKKKERMIESAVAVHVTWVKCGRIRYWESEASWPWAGLVSDLAGGCWVQLSHQGAVSVHFQIC